MANVVAKLSPGASTVHVDGTDITDACQAITIAQRAGEVPTVALELAVFEEPGHWAGTTDVPIIVPERTQAALVALGWTPPEEQETA